MIRTSAVSPDLEGSWRFLLQYDHWIGYQMADAAEAGLKLSGSQLALIREAAGQGYPEEVCGILIGRALAGGGHRVVRVVPTSNGAESHRTTRYVVPPEALVREQRRAREDGLEMIGFYHSHPDHAARPSEHDKLLAWPWYTYIIVSVADGIAIDASAWRLDADRSLFEPQILTVESDT